ncbi:hypothetical protein RJ639_034926 [Escallonia herrerae]|uniref:Reverse transcriptase Ty1/copia-type domain-containing protein n=1 Tax=Escallonia herrerae TaxID=1293975 RepID=A0AA88X592_9ASTE|nr:hypothetical protein RJ639_034926 [Escallonia herrerae]
MASTLHLLMELALPRKPVRFVAIEDHVDEKKLQQAEPVEELIPVPLLEEDTEHCFAANHATKYFSTRHPKFLLSDPCATIIHAAPRVFMRLGLQNSSGMTHSLFAQPDSTLFYPVPNRFTALADYVVRLALVFCHKTVLVTLKNGPRILAQVVLHRNQNFSVGSSLLPTLLLHSSITSGSIEGQTIGISHKVGQLFELINLSIPHRLTIPHQSTAFVASQNSLEMWHSRLGSDLDGIYILKQDLIHHFEMKDLGTLSYFLGLEVSIASDGYYLSQAKYASNLLSRAGLIDSKIASTPIEPNVRFYDLKDVELDCVQFMTQNKIRALTEKNIMIEDLNKNDQSLVQINEDLNEKNDIYAKVAEDLRKKIRVARKQLREVDDNHKITNQLVIVLAKCMVELLCVGWRDKTEGGGSGEEDGEEGTWRGVRLKMGLRGPKDPKFISPELSAYFLHDDIRPSK